MDVGADSTLLYGSLDKFSGPSATTEGYWDRTICVRQVRVTLGIRRLPPRTYQVYVSPISEYILGTDVLQDLTVNTTIGEFHLCIRVVRTIIRGHPYHAPFVLPQATRVVNTKQHLLPGSHEEIGHTILKLEEAGVIRPTHSPYNCPVWPARKPDRSWHVPVDCRELNKVLHHPYMLPCRESQTLWTICHMNLDDTIMRQV